MAGRFLTRFLAAATLLAALMLISCGGGEDSSTPRAELNEDAAAVSERSAEELPADGKGGEPSADGEAGELPDGGQADGGAADGQGSEPSEPASKAEAEDGRKADPAVKKNPKKPKKPAQSAPGVPPQFAGKSIFEIARQLCSDPMILDFVPEDQQDDPEQIAEQARAFAPPGKEQEAYDGCLAGLHDLGL